MPVFEVTAPDGKVLEVNAPEGASQDEVLSYAQKNYNGSTIEQNKHQDQVSPTSLQSMPQGIAQQAGMMARGGFQGMTGGLGDEILAAASALPISALSYAMPSAQNVNPSEAYDLALQKSRNELAQGRQDYPKSMLGAEVGGNIATGSMLAATKPIQSLASWAGRGSLASRAAKIYATATPAIGATLFAEGEGGAKNRLENASMAPVYGLAAPILGGFGKALGSKSMAGTAVRGGTAGGVIGAGVGAYNAPEGEKLEGALTGGAIGATAGAIGAPLLRKANEALGTKSVIPNSEQLRKQASELYKLADSQGGVLKPEVTNQFVDDLNALRPQSEMGKLVSGDTPFTKIIDNFNAIKNKPMTLQDAQELDEALGDAIDGFTELGKLTKQGKKLFDVQTALRNNIMDATEEMTIGGKRGFDTWKQGQKLWATSRKLNDIERIINRSEMMENPATAIKSGFRTLLNNPQRLRGYSKTEIEAMKEAVNTGFVTDTLKGIFGSRLMGVIGGAAHGPLTGVAGAITSAASRGLAEKVQVGKAIKAAEMVATQGKGQVVNPLVTADKLKQIMKLPPKQAKEALKQLEKSKSGQFVKDYIADETGALGPRPDSYYKNPKKLTDKLSSYLDANDIEYRLEEARSGSSYFTVYPKEGGMKTIRISNHNNQSLDSHRDSYDFQVYPGKDGVSGGSSVESVIKNLNLIKEPIKKINQTLTKDFLIEKYGGGNTISDPKTYDNTVNRINNDLKYSDDTFKDIYKANKETIKKIMGIK